MRLLDRFKPNLPLPDLRKIKLEADMALSRPKANRKARRTAQALQRKKK